MGYVRAHWRLSQRTRAQAVSRLSHAGLDRFDGPDFMLEHSIDEDFFDWTGPVFLAQPRAAAPAQTAEVPIYDWLIDSGAAIDLAESTSVEQCSEPVTKLTALF